MTQASSPRPERRQAKGARTSTSRPGLLIGVFAAALAIAAQAGAAPAPGADPRLRAVAYDPHQVVPIRGALGYQTMIEFDPAEQIETVAIGDSLAWQVVPSRRANLLFLKPMDHAPVTNMTVVTNLRSYVFELSVRPGVVKPDDPGLVYSLRFEYAAPAEPVIVAAAPPGPPPPPRDANHAYSYAGSVRNVPLRLFDDGHATYFRFAGGVSLPAIYAVEPDRSESVVNFHVRDGYLVVDRVARGFVLRRGKDETRIFNDGFEEVRPGPLSPRPRPKSGWGLK